MPKPKTTSPARSQSGAITPKRKTTRSSRSLCSPALSTTSGRLTSLIDQFKDKNMESFVLSPLNGRSVLNDNTEIEEPKRKSWWKKLNENSQDVMEVLEDNKLTENKDIEELIDIEVLSQEKKNLTLDLPESSDNESIHSIVLPQRRIFKEKENQPQKKFGQLIDNRESLAKLHKTNTANIDNTVNVGTRELFQNAKRSKPIFPSALLNISPNKTAADKTKENVQADPKPQVRNIFGNRPANKRKNMFADFIVSESEDEIPEIQPKVFGFQKKLEQRRISSVSKGRDASPTSSITTDIEMDFKMLLPSSTMVENQLEDNMLAEHTPIKRARLSKLSEAKESEAGTLQTNTTSDKTKQSDKSVASRNKSKASPDIKEKSLNSSRITRSMLKTTSKCDDNVNPLEKQDGKANKSRSKISSEGNELETSPSKSATDQQNMTLNKSRRQNKIGTRNSSKIIETNVESEEIVVNAINNVTRVINKSTNKSLPNTTATNKSINEKELTVTLKVHDKVNKTGSNDVEENEQEDDENNFTLEFENDVEDEVIMNHNDLNELQKDNLVVLEKDSQEPEINQSKSNKSNLTSISLQLKPAKIVEESVESQSNQCSAGDKVDGNLEQETEPSVGEEIVNQEFDNDVKSQEDINEEMEQEDEVNVSEENKELVSESEENEEAIESEENEDEVSQGIEQNESQGVENMETENEGEEEPNEAEEEEEEDNEANESQEVEAEVNESQEIEEQENESQEVEAKVNGSQEIEEQDNECEEVEAEVNESQEIEEKENESQEVEAKVNGSQEIEQQDNECEEVEAEVNESKEIEIQVNESQEVEAEVNKSNDIEIHVNDNQEVEAEVNKSQKIEEETNESQEIEEEANESQEIEAEANETELDEEEAIESQETEKEANESQEIDKEVHESKEVDADASDEEDDEEMNEEKEEAANESQANEASANESQEVEDDEEENHEVASEAESEEAEDDQQMNDSDEADKAIDSDPEISDDNQADEMEVDDDEGELESDNESEQESDNENEQIEEESCEEKQIDKSREEIEESPNVTHDTTGRHRKKNLNKSPELILHSKTNQNDSFSVKGRNTSVRKSNSMINNLNIKPSLAPSRNSAGFSDATQNSSAEGSGWDSHRTTRKTLRQTFGKDFTPRKSLRALVMEKSAKRQTEVLEMQSETVKFPLANSTEMPEDSNHQVEDFVESDHEVSRRTRQTTLEMYLQKLKQKNIENKLKMEQAIRNSLKSSVTNSLNLFKVPNKPAPRRAKPTQSKAKKKLESLIPFGELPSEVIEDMKYKPPKRFRPTNASWITNRLYKFLETKLEARYDYKARVRAEKLVETIYFFAKDLRRHDVAPTDAVDVLKHEFARLEVVRTHFEFYEFFHDFMPREVRIKVVPDIVNKIPLPRHGVFSDILRGNTGHG